MATKKSNQPRAYRGKCSIADILSGTLLACIRWSLKGCQIPSMSIQSIPKLGFASSCSKTSTLWSRINSNNTVRFSPGNLSLWVRNQSKVLTLRHAPLAQFVGATLAPLTIEDKGLGCAVQGNRHLSDEQSNA